MGVSPFYRPIGGSVSRDRSGSAATIPLPISTSEELMVDLRDADNGHDLVFRCCGELFYAHSVVLRLYGLEQDLRRPGNAGSGDDDDNNDVTAMHYADPRLQQLQEWPGMCAGSDGVVNVDEIDRQSFEQFLAFLYNPCLKITTDIVVSVVSLAKRWGMRALVEACEKFIVTLPRRSLTVDMLTAAHKLQLSIYEQLLEGMLERYELYDFSSIQDVEFLRKMMPRIIKAAEKNHSRWGRTRSQSPVLRSLNTPAMDEAAVSGAFFANPNNGYDIIFIVSGERLHLHKVVLSLSSHVWKKMFSIDMEERHQSEIVIEGKTPEEMKLILRYIYPPNHRFWDIDASNVVPLLSLAMEYDVPMLIERSEAFLVSVNDKCLTIPMVNCASSFGLRKARDRFRRMGNVLYKYRQTLDLSALEDPDLLRQLLMLSLRDEESATTSLQKAQHKVKEIRGKYIGKWGDETVEFKGTASSLDIALQSVF